MNAVVTKPLLPRNNRLSLRGPKILPWILLPLLVACSREPSETQLQQAYRESLNQTNQWTTKIGGKQMQIGLKDFKKLSCAKMEQQNSGSSTKYHCDIQVTLDLPLLGSSTQNGSMTVVRHDNDWVIVNND